MRIVDAAIDAIHFSVEFTSDGVDVMIVKLPRKQVKDSERSVRICDTVIVTASRKTMYSLINGTVMMKRRCRRSRWRRHRTPLIIRIVHLTATAWKNVGIIMRTGLNKILNH